MREFVLSTERFNALITVGYVISAVLITFGFTKMYFVRKTKELEKENFELKEKLLKELNKKIKIEEVDKDEN